MLNIVNQPEAMCKFVSGDCADICMVIVVELDAKELLEKILIRA